MPILIIAFVAAIGFAVFMVRKTLKQMAASDGGVVVPTTNMKTAQEFLPFVDIENGVIDLGGFKYRMIVECTSINYFLKTETEKNIIEGSFRKFLNSINYPISFYIQTKEINYGNIVASLRKDIDETLEVYPQLRDYAEIYYDEIVHMKQSIDNSKQKKKYIIIPYEEAISMNELSPEEKKTYSHSEIHSRASQIIDGVNSLGLVAKALDTTELVELLYSVNHRDDDSFGETIGSGEYLQDIVGTKNKPTESDELKAAIEIFQEAENRIRVNILDHRLSMRAAELFNALAQELNKTKRGLIDIEENQGGYNSLKSYEDLFNEGESVEMEGGYSDFEEDDGTPVMPDASKYRKGGDV